MNDITALMATMKAAAEKASNGEWVKESGDGWEAACSANDQANGGFIIAHFEGSDAAANREFVQAASPANVKALVEALEKAQQANAAQDDHINQQQDRIDTMERRNAELGKYAGELESRTVTPVTYSENSDADRCRKWAWEQVKGELSPEGWTTGDNINYFGFFCWGWDMRRQYNEQRTAGISLKGA